MRIFLLFSLVMLILSSCQKEDNKMISQIDPQIAKLEKQYGIKFEEITGERDSLNTISIPFDKLEQFLEESMNPKSRSLTPTQTRGKGSVDYSKKIIKMNFKDIYFLDKYFLNIEIGIHFYGDIKPYSQVCPHFFLEFGSTYVFINTTLNVRIATEGIYEPMYGHGHTNYGCLFTGKVYLDINTHLNGKWYKLKGTLNLGLDVPQMIKPSFYAGLTLTF